MTRPICASCDRPLTAPEQHGYCERCRQLAEALFDAERDMQAAKALLDALDALQPTVH